MPANNLFDSIQSDVVYPVGCCYVTVFGYFSTGNTRFFATNPDLEESET